MNTGLCSSQEVVFSGGLVFFYFPTTVAKDNFLCFPLIFLLVNLLGRYVSQFT